MRRIQRSPDRRSAWAEADRAGWSTVRTSLKALTATATAALLVSGLAACSSGAPTATPSATPAGHACQNLKSGDTSKSVKVTGDFRATPQVSIPSPISAKDMERTVVITGKGAEAKGGSSVDIALAAYNGTTGKELTAAQGFDG